VDRLVAEADAGKKAAEDGGKAQAAAQAAYANLMPLALTAPPSPGYGAPAGGDYGAFQGSGGW
jgi:hypothetical protein